MKVAIIALLTVMPLTNDANAKITCNSTVSPDVYVEVSGNPLEIFAQTSPGNSGHHFLVEINEKDSIQGENDSYGNMPRIRAELQRGLRRSDGVNAVLILRKFELGRASPLKEIFPLKCKGSVLH